jgi:hypothetical protein
MAVDHKDRWLVNVQHSLYTYLNARLSEVWPEGVIVPEWPEEDRKLMLPQAYDELPSDQQQNYIRLPAMSITLRAPFGARSVELGSRDEWEFTMVQIFLQEVDRARFQIISQYIANQFKNKRVSIYDYELQYPNPLASVVGYLETEKPSIMENNSLGIINSALKWGGLITANAQWRN